jgi:Arc/MetJ-type ribon-helix-helix transcriptional regulator
LRWDHSATFELPGTQGITTMNIALTDDLQQLLRKKVETGQFPDEEAVVHEALKRFLSSELSQGRPQAGSPAEVREGRSPGPFLEDEAIPVPVELPRPGQHVAGPTIPVVTRQPTLLPSE